MTQKFGGDWTEEKLERLGKYLAAYRAIFSANEKAKHFRTWYVDAFAGTGSRTERAKITAQDLFAEDVYEQTVNFRDGSARIACQLASPFDHYLFVEKSKARVAELRETVSRDFSSIVPRCSFEHGDANAALQKWCGERDWNKDRAVVFLDPFGMQVEWKTIQMLGATKGVDLWYLFPLGAGVSRMLINDGKISDTWSERLDTTLGTHDWQQRFYRKGETADLFGDTVETLVKDAPEEKISEFIHERLAAVFAKVAKGRILRNSKKTPLYLLCFAAANEKGASTAIKIAQHLLSS